ncbi:AraC family transcriptional regulator [Clostridiaceae bacterium M8S5]|nr:AraC family transcriptional regulator [Clostridiaceae bacterium M8S5]
MNTKTIYEIIKYIEDHITEVISLNEIGKMVNYSPYHCSASFHKYHGISIKSYIRKRRLQLASEDIRETEMKTIDVAFKYCYSSQEAFSRAFAKQFGVTPFEYRRVHLPILIYDEKKILAKRGNNLMKDESIRNIQNEISGKNSVKVLHVLNGRCMMQEFKENGHFKEDTTYIPFNEAMCWGSVTEDLFSDAFIKARVMSHQITVKEYKNNVIKPLEPLFLNDFNTIVLWFGSDMFCQINMLTILAYLDKSDFLGDVLFCMKNEIANEMLPEAYEIDSAGSYENYLSILCKKEMPVNKMLPATYQAASLYLSYRSPNSEINDYIRKNSSKDRKTLIKDLLKTFPQYGLGDVQFDMMISDIVNSKAL